MLNLGSYKNMIPFEAALHNEINLPTTLRLPHLQNEILKKNTKTMSVRSAKRNENTTRGLR